MKDVFISRKLTAKSPFLQQLSAVGWQVKGESFIIFTPITFDVPPPTADWIFFYSKNGIRYFFEQAKFDEWVDYATIGQPSSDFLLSEYGIKADFVGNGEPSSIATDFIQMAKHKRVLFPCAKNSRHTIQRLLDQDIEAINLTVYDNSIKTNIPTREERVLVFTSPLNAEAYFEQHVLKKHQSLIAIGHTTARALEQLGYHKYRIASEPSEVALAEAVLRLD